MTPSRYRGSAAGIEKLHDFLGLRIYTGEIRTLVLVAAMAGPREVVGLGLAAVLLGNDVFEMEWLETAARNPASDTTHRAPQRAVGPSAAALRSLCLG
jgi:hypothetical protein